MKSKIIILLSFTLSIGYSQNRYSDLPSWSKSLKGNEFDGNIRKASVRNEFSSSATYIEFSFIENTENFNFYLDLRNTPITWGHNSRITTKWVFDDGTKEIFYGNNYYSNNKVFFFNELYNDAEEICFYGILKKINNSKGFSVRVVADNKNVDFRFSSKHSTPAFNFVIGNDASKDDFMTNCSYLDKLYAKTKKDLFAVNQTTSQKKVNSNTLKFSKKKKITR